METDRKIESETQRWKKGRRERERQKERERECVSE